MHEFLDNFRLKLDELVKICDNLSIFSNENESVPEKNDLQNENMEYAVFEQEQEIDKSEQNCPSDKELLNDITEEDYFDIMCTQRTKIQNMSVDGKASDVNSTQRLISMFFQEDSTDDSEVDDDDDISNKAAKCNSPTASKLAEDSDALSNDGVISMENHSNENNFKQHELEKINLNSDATKSRIGFITQETPKQQSRDRTFESPKGKDAYKSPSSLTKNISPSKKRVKSPTPIDVTAEEVHNYRDISPSSCKRKSAVKEELDFPERPAFDEDYIILSEESKDSVCSDVKLSSIEDHDITLSGENSNCEIHDMNLSGRENLNIASQDHDDNSVGESKVTWSPDNSQNVSGTDLFGTPSPNNSNTSYPHCLPDNTPKQGRTGEEDVINSPPSKRARSLNFGSESSKMEIDCKNFSPYASTSCVEEDANSNGQFESDRLSGRDLAKTFGVVDNIEGIDDDDIIVVQSEFNSSQCEVTSDTNKTLNNVAKSTTDPHDSYISDGLPSKKTRETEKYSDSASQEQDMDVIPSPKFKKSKEVRKFRFTKRKYFSPEKLGNDLDIETPGESKNKIHRNSEDNVLSKFNYTSLLRVHLQTYAAFLLYLIISMKLHTHTLVEEYALLMSKLKGQR